LLKAKEQLALKLARIEGRIEGLKELTDGTASEAINVAMAEARGYTEALAILSEVETAPVYSAPKQPVVSQVSTVDPAMAMAMQNHSTVVTQALPTHIKPYLAAKAARIAGAKK
jgi:DNA-binding FrmR family transcriptional regulator